LGHEVYVITSNTSYKRGTWKQVNKKCTNEKFNGFNVVWLKTYLNKKNAGIERIKSWFHFEWQLFSCKKKGIAKPDVVIVSSLSLLTVINAYVFSRRYNAKLIFEVRDIWPLSAMVLGGYSKYNPFILMLSIIERFGYRKSNAIVGTMPNLREHVGNIIGTEDKVYCIPQGLSLDFYKRSKPLDQEYLAKYIPQGKFIVMYTGTLNANNPLQDLITAAKLLKEDKRIHFIIVGEGYEKENLRKLAGNLSNVSFPPFVDKLQVNHLLSFASVCYDSFDSLLAKYGLSRNKWIDYMFAGKPILCAYSGYQSMINEADSGTFVSFGNVKLLEETILKYAEMDNEQLRRIGSRGREFLLEKRTFDKLAKEYINIIDRH